MAGQLKVDSINADSNLSFRIANTAVAFIDSNGLRPTSGSVSLDSTGTTGIRLPSANTLAFFEGGVEAMRIDSSGNVGIGTSSPLSNSLTLASKQVAMTTGYGMSWNSGTTQLAGYDTNILQFITNSSEQMRIDSSGNVGIGASSPSTYGKFAVTTQSANAPTLAITGNGLSPQLNHYINDSTSVLRNLNEIEFVTGSSDVSNYQGYITFSTMGSAGGTISERMRITSDGTLQVKSNTATAPWDATSGNYVWVGGTYPVGGANSDIIAIFNRHTNNGTVVEIKKGTSLLGTISHNGTNTAYNTSSDYRLKENIAPMAGALQTVSLLKPCTYTWKSDGSNGQGFIAHELQECLPDAVTGEKDAVETYTDKNGNEQTRIKPQQIDTSFLVATLTAAIQELKAIVDIQAAEIAELKAR